MKVRVIKRFRDKHTRAIHEIGDVFDVTNKRAKEINSAPGAPFVEEVKDGPSGGRSNADEPDAQDKGEGANA